MSGHVTYGFLLDENLMHLKFRFPKGRALTVTDLGFNGADDDKVVEIAKLERRIIVTNNSRDYRSAMAKFATAWGKEQCSDLYGLVLLPNRQHEQELLFPLHKIEETLRIKLPNKPQRRVRWFDVAGENLLVQISKDRRARVEALPRCPRCVELGTQ
jgi:predicted nuclease of predicted toxin-antitoxin system